MQTIFENDEIKIQIQKQDPSHAVPGGEYVLEVTGKDSRAIFPGNGPSGAAQNMVLLWVRFYRARQLA